MFGVYIIFLVFSILDTNVKPLKTVNKTEDSLATTPIQEINLIDEVENETNEVVSLIRFRPDVIDLKPKVVIILAGINDIAENTGPSSVKMISDNIISMAC